MILVFGSLNVDLVVRVKSLPRPGETVLGPSYDVVAGGKGANQALAAARAGAKTAMVGAVGSDDFAETALAELSAVAGVDLTASPGGDRARVLPLSPSTARGRTRSSSLRAPI